MKQIGWCVNKNKEENKEQIAKLELLMSGVVGVGVVGGVE